MLTPRPLDRRAYAPFGEVVQAGAADGRSVNQGTARKWDRVATLESRRAEASLSIGIFRVAPLERFPHPIALLERHPCSAQAFLPLSASRYLVVVAGGEEAPDLASLTAFVVPGHVGITYHPGIWHHPMIALDSAAEFACWVWEDGSALDCEERYLTPQDLAFINAV